MSGPRFYTEPPQEIIHMYEQRGDGCWYPLPCNRSAFSAAEHAGIAAYEGPEQRVGPRFYVEPPQSIIHMYEQRGDGCWYYIENGVVEDTDSERLLWENDQRVAQTKNPPKNGTVPVGEEGEQLTRQEHYEAMVGDVDSDEKGTGARLNSGKPRFDLVPVRIWLEAFKQEQQNHIKASGLPDDMIFITQLLICVQALAEYQEGKGRADEMMGSVPFEWYVEAARVFEYGANKYKAWNWLKGMDWSVPTACALRHAKAILVDDELTDGESLLPHIGHFTCNLIMLATYADTYPEGNDYPSEEYFNG